jgi:transcriptional regulator with XRE-family HTH domain
MKDRGPAAYGVWSLLREARRKAGLTQRDLAARASTSQSAVARYERAKSMPDIETLQRLLEACGYELRWRLEPLDPTPDRQIREAIARPAKARLEGNRRVTRLAARAHPAPRRPLIGSGTDG